MENKFIKLKEVAEKELSQADHDIDHTMRVYNLSLKLAKDEDVDFDVLKAAALLHDIARAKEDKGEGDHALLGAEMAGSILKKSGFPKDKIQKVQECIASHRYRAEREPKSIEAKILFDADKLDSLGAVGVARAFAWVGRNNAKIYSEENIEEYAKRNLKDGKIRDKTKHFPRAEFETKLKFLPEKLYTPKAKKISKEKATFIKRFLDSLEKEIKEGIE